MAKTFRQKPDSQAVPENRLGTRTHRGYMHHCAGGNHLDGGRVSLFATPRQLKKGRRLMDMGLHSRAGPGRVIRACMRAYAGAYSDFCNDPYFGGP